MAEHSGDGSYVKLITDMYGIKTRGNNVTRIYQEYDTNVAIHDLLISNPMSYHLSGYYRYLNGERSNRISQNFVLGKRVYFSSTYEIISQHLFFGNNILRIYGYYDYLGQGQSVRCGAK